MRLLARAALQRLAARCQEEDPCVALPPFLKHQIGNQLPKGRGFRGGKHRAARLRAQGQQAGQPLAAWYGCVCAMVRGVCTAVRRPKDGMARLGALKGGVAFTRLAQVCDEWGEWAADASPPGRLPRARTAPDSTADAAGGVEALESHPIGSRSGRRGQLQPSAHGDRDGRSAGGCDIGKSDGGKSSGGAAVNSGGVVAPAPSEAELWSRVQADGSHVSQPFQQLVAGRRLQAAAGDAGCPAQPPTAAAAAVPNAGRLQRQQQQQSVETRMAHNIASAQGWAPTLHWWFDVGAVLGAADSVWSGGSVAAGGGGGKGAKRGAPQGINDVDDDVHDEDEEDVGGVPGGDSSSRRQGAFTLHAAANNKPDKRQQRVLDAQARRKGERDDQSQAAIEKATAQLLASHGNAPPPPPLGPEEEAAARRLLPQLSGFFRLRLKVGVWLYLRCVRQMCFRSCGWKRS